jgi:uncharacterized protein (TIGR00645 family)
MSMVSQLLERFLFASRWLLAPFYVCLVIGLLFLLLQCGLEVWHFASFMSSMKEIDVILAVLSLVDLTLTGSLIVIVIFSGYENFVSKIDVGDHPDWPEWMAKIDFSGLKLKLLSSIVAISGIQLLKSFMDIRNISDRELAWYVAIHMTFVISGLLLAWTDRLSSEKH